MTNFFGGDVKDTRSSTMSFAQGSYWKRRGCSHRECSQWAGGVFLANTGQPWQISMTSYRYKEWRWVEGSGRGYCNSTGVGLCMSG
jgi:hypothetical protein